MKAIILAAGYGTRMRPLTEFVPKPMVRAGGKNFVERTIEQLPQEINEVILVVGYLKEQVMNHFGDSFMDKKITYVFQEEPLGTAHAVGLCEKFIDDRFMILMGDDVVSRNDIAELLQHERAMMVSRVEGMFSGGKIIYDDKGTLRAIEEGEHKNGFINTNVFVLTPHYFEYDMVPIKEGSEFGLPQTVVQMAQKYPVDIVEATQWQQMSNLDDVARLHKELTNTPFDTTVLPFFK